MIYLEHLNRLNEGVESWNKWRSDNPHIRPILIDVDLSLRNLNGINFSNASLERAELMGTQLIQANLRGAKLRNAKLCGVEHFHPTDTINTQRYQTCNLSDADLTDADLTNTDLTDAELSNAKLVRTNLTKAELNGAYFNNANLQEANLSLARVIYTSFVNANLTGACIQNWQYSSDTKFYEVSCKYIYYGIEYDSISQSWNFKDRIPHNPEIDFKDGEFEKFIQKAQNTVDLIFTNGIDWQAFLQAFLKLKSETGDELSIYSIEDKWDGHFVIRVNVPPDADKKEIETLLKVKDAEIEGFRRENLTLQRIIESKPQIIQQIFFGDANGIAAIVEGDQNIYPPQTDIIDDGYNKKE
jgi:hypothetical protein